MTTTESNKIPAEYRVLEKGMTVAGHTVIRCKRLTERSLVGETYATWITLCEYPDQDRHHKWVTWLVIARPEGFTAESGHYFTHDEREEAIGNYERRSN